MECYKCHKDKPSKDFYKRRRKVKDPFLTHTTYCKACISEAGKEYRKRNPEKVKAYAAIYRSKAGTKIKSNARATNRRKVDPVFKMACYLRSRTLSAFKQRCWKKDSRTEKMLGADYHTVLRHIEASFSNGMNWRNYGKWHIDHVKPLSSAKTIEDLLPLCHYTNLQPLWAIDNMKKGKKIL